MPTRNICYKYTGSNTPVINTTGCVIGDGTIGNPVNIRLSGDGNIICTASGLAVSGITAIASVIVSGCLVGTGTAEDPIYISLDPNGNIICGVSGLSVSGITAVPGGSDTELQYNDNDSFGGMLGVNWDNSLNELTMTSQASGSTPLKIAANAGQTNNLLEITNSAGAILANFDEGGTLRGSYGPSGGSTNLVIGNFAGDQNIGAFNVFMGRSAGFVNTSGNNNVAIGYFAYNSGSADSLNTVSIGASSKITGDNATAIGYSAEATTNSIAIGYFSDAVNANSIAIGQLATTNASNQLVIGSATSPITTMYIGEGVVSTSTQSIIINGTGGSGSNNAGSTVYLSPGRSTGTATPANVIIQGTRPTTTGSTAQTLLDVATFGVVRSTIEGSGCLQIPVGPTGARPSTPLDGDLRVNTTLGTTEIYRDSVWRDLEAGTSSSGTTILELGVTSGQDPSGWVGTDGSINLVYDSSLGNFYGYIADDGTEHPIHRSSCYTIDNTGGGIGTFTNAENPTTTQILSYLSGISITLLWTDIVTYLSPDGQRIDYDVCAIEGDQSTAQLVKRQSVEGVNDIGTTTLIDLTYGFRNKGVTIISDPTALDFSGGIRGNEYILEVTNGGNSDNTITWDSEVVWSGTPPQPTVGASGTNPISVFRFYYDGTNYHGGQ